MTSRAFYPSADGVEAASTPSSRNLKLGTEHGPNKPPPTTAPTPTPAPDPAQELHLLRRATYGPTPAGINEIAHLGRAAWLERQLAPATVADPDGDAVSALFPNLSLTATRARATMTAFSGDLLYAFLANTIGRSVWSSRQLHEVMVAFWNDHLHIAGAYYDAWESRHRFDLDVIRKHALGSFAEMLQASTRHPAMQRYLDQNNSKATSLNENLGRELLELHTVGAYTEADVLASSRMLTGLSIDSNGEFVYKSNYHYVGSLTIVGWTHQNASADGQPALTSYLDFLARHPLTAKRIARKLAVRFVTDSPSIDLVDRIAQVYLDNDTMIVPVLRYLFTSADFAGSVGQKLRTPQEDIYAQLRAIGIGRPTGGEELRQLYWALSQTGHAPLNWAPPNGFPDTPAHWATPTTALARLSLHMDISGGWWPQLTGYPKNAAGTKSLGGLLPSPLPPTHGALVQAMGQRLLFGPLPDQVRDAVLGFFGATAGTPLTASSQIVGWQLPYLVALLFDSPAHTVR